MNDGHLTLSERFDRMERSLDKLSDAYGALASHDAADAQRLRALDRRVSAVEAWQTWALRVVLGLVAAGVAAAVGLVTG